MFFDIHDDDSVAARSQWIQIVGYMYDQLGDTDMTLALHRKFALNSDTKAAIALENYGLIAQVSCC